MIKTKSCAKCKIIFPNNRNYFTFTKKGRSIPYCKKCNCLITKQNNLKGGKKSICHCCRIEFTVPKNGYKGAFCSQACFKAFTRSHPDDTELLRMRGIVNDFSC